jgi:hypothetical protein
LASRRLCRPVFRSCRATFETGRRDSTSRESFTCNSRKSGIHAERSPALASSRTESKRATRSPSRAARPGASFPARLSGIKWAGGHSVPPSEPAGIALRMNPVFRACPDSLGARPVIDSFSLGCHGSPLKDAGQANPPCGLPDRLGRSVGRVYPPCLIFWRVY